MFRSTYKALIAILLSHLRERLSVLRRREPASLLRMILIAVTILVLTLLRTLRLTRRRDLVRMRHGKRQNIIEKQDLLRP